MTVGSGRRGVVSGRSVFCVTVAWFFAYERGAVIERRWIRFALLAATTTVALPLVGTARAAAPAADTAESTARDLLNQERTLNDPEATQQQRDEAARRLVSRDSREADEVLARVFNDPSSRETRLAIVRALADDPTPDRAFFLPLGTLLGEDSAMTAAAAQALAAYKTPAARDRLLRFVQNASMPYQSRVGAVRALGKLVDKPTVGELVHILSTEDAPQIRNAAVDALIDITGEARFGHDLQLWEQWWAANRGRPEQEWAADLLGRNRTRVNELGARLDALREYRLKEVQEFYRRLPAEERPRYMLNQLRAPALDVRVTAVQAIYDEISLSGPASMPPEVYAALRGMVGDSVSEVRREVARTLERANDKAAVDPLLTQLAQETDPDVTAAILLALGPSLDVKVVGPIVERLDDRSFTVARAAADALRVLAPELRQAKHAALAGEVALRLHERLRRTDTPAASQLRASVVWAIANLGHRSSTQVFYQLIRPTEKVVQVRRLALGGLRRIGAPESADNIIGAGALEDPEPGVRLDAVAAMETTASFGHIVVLKRRMNAQVESDPDVRRRAWEVIALLLKKGSVNELSALAKDLDMQAPERRSVILNEIVSKLRPAPEAPPLPPGREAEQLALFRQNLGEALLQLKRYDDAAAHFRQSLDYWESTRAAQAVRLPSMLLLMESLLKGKRFEDAGRFATACIGADRANTSDMWVKTKQQYEALRAAKDWDGVLLLVAEAKKVPFTQEHLRQLENFERDAQVAKTTGGRMWLTQEAAEVPQPFVQRVAIGEIREG